MEYILHFPLPEVVGGKVIFYKEFQKHEKTRIYPPTALPVLESPNLSTDTVGGFSEFWE